MNYDEIMAYLSRMSISCRKLAEEYKLEVNLISNLN